VYVFLSPNVVDEHSEEEMMLRTQVSWARKKPKMASSTCANPILSHT
jgi:hypothetical protein